MAHYKFTVSVGMGQGISEVVEVANEDLEGMTDDQIDLELWKRWAEWNDQFVEGDYEKVDDEDD